MTRPDTTHDAQPYPWDLDEPTVPDAELQAARDQGAPRPVAPRQDATQGEVIDVPERYMMLMPERYGPPPPPPLYVAACGVLLTLIAAVAGVQAWPVVVGWLWAS